MAYTDYKWWCVNRNGDGYITWARVRFHVGEYQQKEDPETKEKVDVYVRTARVDAKSVDVAAVAPTWKQSLDGAGNPYVEFTDKDFGKIKTDDELRTFCNTQLDKLKAIYTVIPEQKVADLG